MRRGCRLPTCRADRESIPGDPMSEPVRRILFIKPSSLGDIVHAMPTLAVLRERFPQAEVTWLVKRQWAPVVHVMAGVDRVCAVDQGMAGWLSRVPELRAAGFDLVVDLQGLFRSGAMARLTGCARRIGFANAREGSPLLYTERVAVPATPMHAVDRYLLVAEALGAVRPARPRFDFIDRPEDRQAVDTLIARAGIDESSPWVAMNVSARWETKRWPPQHFAEAADQLAERYGVSVVLMGGPAERPESQAVTGRMRTKAVDLTGQTPVGLLPGLLRRASLLLTNDSGPMHIAAAVDTPVVALFGPTDPVKTGPYGHGHVVLSYAVDCRPCLRRECARAVALECLTGVRPEQVVQAVMQQLGRTS